MSMLTLSPMPGMFQMFALNARPKFLPAARDAQAVPCPLVRALEPLVPIPMDPLLVYPVGITTSGRVLNSVDLALLSSHHASAEAVVIPVDPSSNVIVNPLVWNQPGSKKYGKSRTISFTLEEPSSLRNSG